MVPRDFKAAQHGGDSSPRVTLPISEFLTVWAILTLNLLTPGPNVLNTMTTAMGSGRPAGLASAVAVAPGIGLWCLGMSLGMAALFQVVPGAEESLTIMAAGLLVYFSTRYLRSAFSVTHREAALKSRGGLSVRASFLRSLSINATNPKALTTWLAILGIFPTAQAAIGDIVALTLGASALGFAVHAAYAVIFSTRPAAVLYLRAAPVINGTVGVFFAGFAIKLVAPLLARAL